jgi:hypothetical protein
LYAALNIIRVIKAKRLRCAGHVARMGATHTKFCSENLKGRDKSEDPNVDGRIILEWILGKRGGICRLNASASGYGTVAGCCERGNEHSGFMKCGEFLD